MDRKASGGFTVFELLITLALLASVSLVAVSLSDLQEAMEVSHETTLLHASLEHLSALAPHQSAPIILQVRGRGYSASLGEEVSLFRRDLPKGVRLTGNRGFFRFSSSGHVTPGTISLKGKRRACLITIALYGRVSKQCR